MSIIEYIIHQDEHLLVLDKPADVSLLADRSGSNCLWDELKEWAHEQNSGKPLQVHRLDKGTSGVLLVALSREAQSSLTKQLQDRTVTKVYTAITAGIPDPASARIDLPLKPGRKSRFRIAGPRDKIILDRQTSPIWRLRPPADILSRDSFPAQTQYRVVERRGDRARVLLKPKTGRTHQLRVHLSWLGFPICGDHLYGKPNDPLQQAERLMLHCRKMVVWCDWEKKQGPRVFRSPVPF